MFLLYIMKFNLILLYITISISIYHNIIFMYCDIYFCNIIIFLLFMMMSNFIYHDISNSIYHDISNSIYHDIYNYIYRDISNSIYHDISSILCHKFYFNLS